MARQQTILEKFKAAQTTGSSGVVLPANFRTFTSAVAEMRAGARRGNWAAHVLPALNVHAFNDEYHIENFDQAVAYLRDPQLGRNLGYILTVILQQTPAGVDVETLMAGAPGVKQLHACVTLWDYILNGCNQEQNGEIRLICSRISKKFFNGENNTEPDTVRDYALWNDSESE